VGTLNNLYHRREAGEIPPFDNVVIETSGLADPAPVAQAFLSDPTLAGLYFVSRMIVTVDAANAPGTTTSISTNMSSSDAIFLRIVRIPVPPRVADIQITRLQLLPTAVDAAWAAAYEWKAHAGGRCPAHPSRT